MTVSQKVHIDTNDYGASLTLPTLANLTTGATIADGTAASCNEQTAHSGVYIADFVGASSLNLIPAGTYRILTSVSGAPLKRFVTLTGVDGEVAYARTDATAELDSVTLSKIDAILEDTGTTLPGQISSGGTESTLMVSTTIATLASQTSFTLTAGSADNDAYNRQLVVITDAATSTQKARGIVSDYVGSSKTVTLTSAPAFTIAAGDSISIVAIGSDVSSVQVLSAVSSAIASAGITTTVTGMPTFLRVGDARTVANGGAIPVRLYNVDDDSLLFGLGTNLFEDATITFSLRRAGTDVTEGVEDAAIPCTWVEDGSDGYVQIAYEADALDDCDAMDKLKEKDCHRWGIKFQWGTDDPITPIYGNISVLRKIVTTQS